MRVRTPGGSIVVDQDHRSVSLLAECGTAFDWFELDEKELGILGDDV
jgi:hypothetical protein